MPSRPPLVIPPHEPHPAPGDLASRLADRGVTLTSTAREQLSDYLGRLLAMNTQMNLISRLDATHAWDRHILDSLTLVPLLADLAEGGRVLDVGSGGGLPGIPLAIARPDLRVTLLDATQKKTRFLSDVATAMELDNVAVVNGRAEDLHRGELAGQFDVVTARAVSRLEALARVCAPFAKRGGRLLFIKGQKAEQELAGAKRVLRRLRLTLVGVAPTSTGRIVVLRRS